MNMQKYILSSVVAAVFIFFYGWVVYDMLLSDYIAHITAPGLMPETTNILYIALGCLAQGLGLGLIYVRGHEDKGAMEGVRFGLIVGLFILGFYILFSGVSPMSLRAGITYAILDTIMYVGVGVCFSMVYKK